MTGGGHWELAIADQSNAIVYFLDTADGEDATKANIICWMQHHDSQHRTWGMARWRVPIQGPGPDFALGVMLFMLKVAKGVGLPDPGP